MLKELLSFDPLFATQKRNVAILKTFDEHVRTEKSAVATKIAALLTDLIQQKSYEEIAAIGDTFLWQTLLLYFTEAADTGNRQHLLECILMHLFDNFFHNNADDIKINLESFARKDFCLPKKHLMHNFSSNKDKSVVVDNIHLLDLPAEAYTLLLARFIPQQEINKICMLTDSLQERIVCTLEIIKTIDNDLYFYMSNLLNYIFPLSQLNNSIRTSFSTANLNGVIFISDGGTLMDFCEALIHEFYHNELNIMLQFKVLFNPENGNVYYSPWREDLRPIGGLIHAIYVFVGVIEFYTKVLKSDLACDSVKLQREAIAKKINVAFWQVDKVSLTPLGIEFVQKLYQKFSKLIGTESIDISLNDDLKAALINKANASKSLPSFISDVAL